MTDTTTAITALGAASILLRLALGGLFVVHGYPKLFTNRNQIQQAMAGAGVPPTVTGLVGTLEFFGGIALIVGFLTPLVAGLFAVLMGSTTLLQRLKFHKSFAGGYELDVVLMVASIALIVLGAGAISLDALIGV
ncbi:MAG TPA: DoxX family protein [Nitrososphaerales archaeon]|nr:DoxX family protein [Nitrososphaerales archaeon]